MHKLKGLGTMLLCSIFLFLITDSGALNEKELSFDDDDNSEDEPPQPHSKDDEQFMKTALEAAKQSPDPKVQVL